MQSSISRMEACPGLHSARPTYQLEPAGRHSACYLLLVVACNTSPTVAWVT